MTRQRHIPLACPQCGKPLVTVKDTLARQGSIWRRRQCPDGHRAWTKEALQRDAA